MINATCYLREVPTLSGKAWVFRILTRYNDQIEQIDELGCLAEHTSKNAAKSHARKLAKEMNISIGKWKEE